MEPMHLSTQQLQLQKDNAIRLWGLVACILASLLFVVFQGGKLAYMLFVIVSALSLYLMLGRWSGIAKVRGARSIQKQGELSGFSAGSSIPVSLSAQIPGFWPLPYVIVKEEVIAHHGDKYAFEVTFVPDWKRTGKITYYTPPLRRGVYHFSPTLCLTEDIFGIFRHYGIMRLEQSFIVLPQIVTIKEWKLLVHLVRGAHHHTVSSKALRETTQINGVREYVYGDRISRIHWNATARTGTWKSKEFERETLPRTMIVLDCEQAAYPDDASFELAVSTAASLFQFGIGRELPLGLIASGQKSLYIEAGKGIYHMRKVLEHLVTVEADGGKRLEEVLLQYMEQMIQGSLIVVISPRQGEELREFIRLMKHRQFNFCHIWIRSSNDRANMPDVSKLKAADYVTYPVSHLQELSVVLGGRGV